MTAERQRMGISAMGWGVVLGLTILSISQEVRIKDLGDRVATLEVQASGRQQGVSAPERSPGVREAVPQVQQFQKVTQPGPLAQPVEQRTFNPLSACTPAQPEAKLGGFPREFSARSAPGCSRLHGDRASGGRQEMAP